jgi:peptidylprolyl isomerase
MKFSRTLLSLAIATIVSSNAVYAQDTQTKPETAAAAPAPAINAASAALNALQAIDTTVGTGLEAAPGKIVIVHYSGWLRDPQAADQHGKAFDSSIGRGPFSFPLGAHRVIPGWDQGVAGMKIGGKRTLLIPAAMAYGSRGAGAVIPPDADLVFDVELLDVVTPQPKPVVEVSKFPLEKIDRKVGKGVEAKPGQQISVHYTGWLLNPKAKDQHGKEFDSSKKRGPFEFNLGAGEVIAGWDQGVVGMKVGGKRTLVIPSPMAYGPTNVGNGLIPPNSDLIFDVELLKIKTPKK